MDNNELLQKVVDTTLIGAGGGGMLNPEQADRFIDYMVSQTVLTNEARVVRMNAPTRDIDKIGLGTRIAKKATENVDDSVEASPAFEKISLQTVKIRLDWSLTSESLEDNLEGDALEDHVARLMATQLGNDLEDLYINGDLTSGNALLSALEGWRKLTTNGAHVVTPSAALAAAGLSKELFNLALKAVPNKYLQRRGDLRFYTGSGMIQDFLMTLTNRATLLGDSTIFGSRTGARAGGPTDVSPFGINIVEVPLFSEASNGSYTGATGNHGFIELTFPQNRIVGIQREIKVYREFKPKRDAIEYTVFTRVANQIENLDAYVVLNDVKIL